MNKSRFENLLERDRKMIVGVPHRGTGRAEPVKPTNVNDITGLDQPAKLGMAFVRG